MTQQHCNACGAIWFNGITCTDHFHTISAWELQYQLYNMHHLMVLCYHLQHPQLYSPQALDSAKQLLVNFYEGDVSPQDVLKRTRQALDSGKRDYKITGTENVYGVYQHPVVWRMHVGAVVQAGRDVYYTSIKQWTESIIADLRLSDNL